MLSVFYHNKNNKEGRGEERKGGEGRETRREGEPVGRTLEG
jgi:hypothetical protein